MKKTFFKVLALALVAVMACVLLASCGGPSGEYGSDDYTLKFSGSNVTVSWKGITQSFTMTGKFEMGEKEDGSRTITFTMDEVEGPNPYNRKRQQDLRQTRIFYPCRQI